MHLIDKSTILKALKEPFNFILYYEEEGFLKPHYYIILPTQKIDELIVLTMITSQIDKIEAKYKNNQEALKCLIYADETIMPILIKKSVIDCNTPKKATIDEILSMQKLKIVKTTIPKEFIREISKKINGSKFPRPNIKKMIDLSIIKE